MSNDVMPFVNGVVQWVFFLQMRGCPCCYYLLFVRCQVAGASPLDVPRSPRAALKLNLRGCFAAFSVQTSKRPSWFLTDACCQRRHANARASEEEPWRRPGIANLLHAASSLVGCQPRTRVSTLMAPKNRKLLFQPCFGDSFMLLLVNSKG